jgi:putative MATE family efflux protein
MLDKRIGRQFSYPFYFVTGEKFMNHNGKDLTQGSIYKNLLYFATPFLLANFVQALYGTVDMAVVGWFTDASGITAVSIGSQIMTIVNSLVTGVTMGGTILIAQFLGAQQQGHVKDTIGTMLTMFLIIGTVLSIVMFLLCPWLLILLQTPEKAFVQALHYTQIAACGILFTLLYNGISAVLRGMGDSVRPLIFITVACITNILLDLILVGALKQGAAGAALATILSQGISMILAILYLKRKDFVFDFKLRSFRIHKRKALQIIRLGLPISLQETMVNVSFLIIAATVNTLGISAAAAVGIAGKFDGFAMLPASALSGAIASMVGQNIGSKRPDRAIKTLKIGIAFSFVCALFFFFWVQLAPASILQLFKAEDDVMIAGAEYMRAFGFDFLMVSFVFCMNGFFNGCGSTMFSMINGLLSTFLVRIPLVFLLGNLLTSSLFGIGLAAPLASLLSIIVGLCYLKSARWKHANARLITEAYTS